MGPNLKNGLDFQKKNFKGIQKFNYAFEFINFVSFLEIHISFQRIKKITIKKMLSIHIQKRKKILLLRKKTDLQWLRNNFVHFHHYSYL